MRISLALTILLVTAPLAAAQSFPPWFSADGRVALGYSDRVPGADAFLVGDVTLRFQPQLSGVLGFELGAYGRADALDTPHETFGAVIWDFGRDARLAVGVPRPAYDGFAISALEHSFPSLGIDATGGTRSAATNGAMFANWLPYGISFSGRRDAFQYAASVHEASNVGMTVASFGAATAVGNWQFSGAVEVTWGAGSNVSGKLQARGPIGPVTGGIGYYSPSTVGGSDLVEAFADYLATDNITISAVMQAPTNGAADPTTGIAARYSITPNAALSIGVASDAGSDAVFSAFLEWQFGGPPALIWRPLE